jgi:hypothetical protein
MSFDTQGDLLSLYHLYSQGFTPCLIFRFHARTTATTTAISPSQLPSETAIFLRFAPFSPRTQSLENEYTKNANLFSAFIY